MNIWTFALRNIGRNRRRTVITLTCAAVTAALMTVYGSLVNGFRGAMRQAVTQLEIGDAQVHADNFPLTQDLYSMVDIDKVPLGEWQKDFFISPRLYGFALAATGELSVGAQLRGIDLEQEKKLTDAYQHLAFGSWLSEADTKGVVIGGVMAKKLRLKVGDEVVLIAQAADGSLANELFKVRGILEALNENIDVRTVFMLESSWRGFFLFEKGYHELALRQKNPQASLEEQLKKIEISLPKNYALSTWEELKPIVARIIKILALSVYFNLSVAYVALGGLILNSTTMSIFERIREIGIMKALGLMPKQIVTLIFAETLWQILFAVILTLLLGIPAALMLQKTGLDFSWVSPRINMADLSLQPTLYAELSWHSVVIPITFLTLIMLIATLYPSYKAGTFKPLDAIKFN